MQISHKIIAYDYIYQFDDQMIYHSKLLSKNVLEKNQTFFKKGDEFDFSMKKNS